MTGEQEVMMLEQAGELLLRILGIVNDASKGKISAKDASDQLGAIRAAITTSDAAADAALSAKFRAEFESITVEERKP